MWKRLVLLGDPKVFSRSHVSCNAFKGEFCHMYVSLFEGWQKNAVSDVAHLEGQRQMHPELANVLDGFNSKKDKAYSLMNANSLAVYKKDYGLKNKRGLTF